MNVRDLTTEWHSEWDAFCRASDDAWFRHTTDWLEYNLNYKPEFEPTSESFVLTHSKEIIAICPLIAETRGGMTEFTYGGGYGPTPAFSNEFSSSERKTAMKKVFEEVDRRADGHDVSRTRMQHPTLAAETPFDATTYNYLVQFGFVDTSINTQLVDLDRPLESLRSDVEKDFRRNLRNAKEVIDVSVFTSSDITREVFDKYKQIHVKDAGRQTRSDATFDMMFEWIMDDKAILIAAEHEGEFVGFEHFITYDGGGYSASTARDPDSDVYHVGIGHLLQWRGLEWMAERGMKTYEPGWQHFGNTFPHLASEKDVHISRFKRGTGGETYPLFRGDKYYDGELFRDVYGEKVERYADELGTP